MEDDLTVPGLLLVADDVARDQWHRLLSRDNVLPENWTVQTPKAFLADGGRVGGGFIVVADELDFYFGDELAAALIGSRAVLGLCASPAGLPKTHQLRKYIGRALEINQPTPPLDLKPLAVKSQLPAHEAELESSGEAREKLLAVDDPQDLLNYYLKEIRQYPLLTADEEIELAKKIEAGLVAEAVQKGMFRTRKLSRAYDNHPGRYAKYLTQIAADGQVAKKRFIVSNLRLAFHIARRYSSRMEIMDLIQEANLGLMRAVEKFDYTQGYKFSTYATWWIRQAISRAIADKVNLIRLPVHVHESDGPILTEWRRQEESFLKVCAADVAAVCGISVEQVEAAVRRHRRPYSLEVMAEQGFDLVDPIDVTAHEQATFASLQRQLETTFQTLSEREVGIIRLRYGMTDGNEYTLDQIGQIYGVTRERIRQLQGQALTKLREPNRAKELIDYFDGIIDPDLIASDSGPRRTKKRDRLHRIKRRDR